MHNVFSICSKIGSVILDLFQMLHIKTSRESGMANVFEKSLLDIMFLIKLSNNTSHDLHNSTKLIASLNKSGLNVIHRQRIFSWPTGPAREFLLTQRILDLSPYNTWLAQQLSEDLFQPPSDMMAGVPNRLLYFKDSLLSNTFRLIMDGATLVAIHKARYYMRSDGLALGPGAFVTGLEYSTGCKSEVVGKPEAKFFHSALDEMGCKPEEAIMIGDDARDDVGGAQDAGLLGILVKTGKYRTGDEEKINPSPGYVAESFAQAVEYIIEKYL
ncbi:unnamed protein product, partial [Meganyctiphanes norvegica]